MKIRLHKLFTQLKREYPDIPAHAKILGCGYFSIVIDNRDGTLTKAFVRHRNRFGSLSWDRKIFENEVRTLEMLNGSLLGNVATPKLVQEPVILNHGSKRGDFLGLLRMTKLEGRSASWWTLAETGTPLEKKNHFEQVGALMAHFHAATQNFTKSKIVPLEAVKTESGEDPALTVSDRFHAFLNERLEAIHRYFQTHAKSAIAHGDFHDRNILVDDRNNVTGLVDFGFCQTTENHLSDFYGISYCPDLSAAAFAMQGYEQASGTIVDPLMLSMGRIRQDLRWLKWYKHEPGQWGFLQRGIAAELRKIEGAIPLIAPTKLSL